MGVIVVGAAEGEIVVGAVEGLVVVVGAAEGLVIVGATLGAAVGFLDGAAVASMAPGTQDSGDVYRLDSSDISRVFGIFKRE